MRTALIWILLLLLSLGGFYGTYALSEAFRSDSEKAWKAETSQAARWLSATVLGWLEESYAPLSGLAILFENSREVTEVEFLAAADALKARATAFFIDAKAAARYSVTTRTVSAGADLSITWYVNKATSSLLYAGQCLFRTGSMPTRRARSEVNRPSGSTRRLIARRSR